MRLDPVTPSKRRDLPGAPEEHSDHTELTRAPVPWDKADRDGDDSLIPQPGPITQQTGSVNIDDGYDLAKGTSLGEYRIEGKIGQGGMGVVYAAIHPLIGKRAAIKILKRELCADPTNLERFMTEARVVNEIGHPNIVDIFAFGEMPDGRCYFVMEWLKGETLRGAMSRSRLTIEEISAIVKPLTRALEAAHAKRVIHRDLKPDNVFLADVSDERPKLKLLDFGIAKLARSDTGIERTATGAMMGTPQYIAPEQAKGYAIDHRADIYALGGMLFEMLTGRPPFVADNAMEIVAKHLMEPAPRPSSLVPGVPPALDALVVAMLEKDPPKRPDLAAIRATLDEAKRQIGAEPSVTGVPALPAGEWSEPSAVSRLVQSSGPHPSLPASTPMPPLAQPVRVLTPTPPRRSSSPVLADTQDLTAIRGGDTLGELDTRAPSPSPSPSQAHAAPKRRSAMWIWLLVAGVAAAVGTFFLVGALTAKSPPAIEPAAAVEPPVEQAVEPPIVREPLPDPVSVTQPTKPAQPAKPVRVEAPPAPGVKDPPPIRKPTPTAPRRGTLTVQVRGATSATILVDGHPVGSGASLERQLAYGEHVVEVRAPGMVAQRKTVHVGKQPITYRVTLVSQKPVDPTDEHGLMKPGSLKKDPK